METQYTKGYWAAYPPSQNQGKKSLNLSGHVISGHGEVIAQCNSGMGRSEGNARLIAEIPNLLEALEECVICLEHSAPAEGRLRKAAIAGRQAINKATGKA